MILNSRGGEGGDLYIQNGYGTEYLNESYHFIIGEIWTPQYEAIEMLHTNTQCTS